MTQVALLSNGKYDVLPMHEGTGYGRSSGPAVAGSRRDGNCASQVLSAMRHGFGGHVNEHSEGTT